MLPMPGLLWTIPLVERRIWIGELVSLFAILLVETILSKSVYEG